MQFIQVRGFQMQNATFLKMVAQLKIGGEYLNGSANRQEFLRNCN
jgi:hypothetical protein